MATQNTKMQKTTNPLFCQKYLIPTKNIIMMILRFKLDIKRIKISNWKKNFHIEIFIQRSFIL